MAVDLWTDAVLLGFGLAQVVWRTTPDRPDVLLPRLHSVHPSAVEWSETEAQWYVSTTRGRIPSGPVTGSGCCTPAIRPGPVAVGRPRRGGRVVPSDSFAAADGRRRSEVVGQGIWKAKLPAGGADPDGKSFVSKLRTLGRGGSSHPAGQHPGVELRRGTRRGRGRPPRHLRVADAHRGGRIRLAILGQDLTSQNNTVGTNASSNTGADVLRMIVRADAKAWEACIEEQLLRPLDAYLGRTGSELSVDYDEAMDPETMARAQTETARAAMEWRAAGVAVDMEAMADSVSVPRGAPVVAPVAGTAAPVEAPQPTATLAAPDLSPPKGVREARALAAPKLPTSDDITREMVRLLQAHGVAGIPDVLAALEGAQPAEVRDRLAKAIDKAPRRSWYARSPAGSCSRASSASAQAVIE